MKWSERIKQAKEQRQENLVAKIRRGAVNSGELGEDVKQLDFLTALEEVLTGVPDDDTE